MTTPPSSTFVHTAPGADFPEFLNISRAPNGGFNVIVRGPGADGQPGPTAQMFLDARFIGSLIHELQMARAPMTPPDTPLPYPDFPRRACMEHMVPAELAIGDAIEAVEKSGCHPLLTDAVVLLAQARDKVADFVDLPRAADPAPASVSGS